MKSIPLIMMLLMGGAMAQDNGQPGMMRPSMPECPKREYHPDQPERYYEHRYHYGDVEKGEFCIETVDREQKAPNGGRCRVMIKCGGDT